MKKLITAKILEDFAQGDSKHFPIDNDTLITPSAKDLARNSGITFVYENKINSDEKRNVKKDMAVNSLCEKECEGKESDNIDRKIVVEVVLEVLKEKGLLDKIVK